jgi:SAM-dependent methyltransferase
VATDDRGEMDRAAAEKILCNVDYWHYPFDLPFGMTKPSRPGVDPQRHLRRKRHFFDPLVQLYGGSLRGKNVLDLGCCQGFWSINASRAGARCVGIDSSEAFIREASAVAEVLSIANCEFRLFHLENDLWWEGLAPAHITFFLGLFYHLADPIFVFRKAAGLTLETIVIDTESVAGEDAYLKIVPRNPEEFTTRSSNISTKIRMVPTKQAVCDLLFDAGFSDIRYLPPDPTMPADYLAGERISIIARRM